MIQTQTGSKPASRSQITFCLFIPIFIPLLETRSVCPACSICFVCSLCSIFLYQNPTPIAVIPPARAVRGRTSRAVGSAPVARFQPSITSHTAISYSKSDPNIFHARLRKRRIPSTSNPPICFFVFFTTVSYEIFQSENFCLCTVTLRSV